MWKKQGSIFGHAVKQWSHITMLDKFRDGCCHGIATKGSNYNYCNSSLPASVFCSVVVAQMNDTHTCSWCSVTLWTQLSCHVLLVHSVALLYIHVYILLLRGQPKWVELGIWSFLIVGLVKYLGSGTTIIIMSVPGSDEYAHIFYRGILITFQFIMHFSSSHIRPFAKLNRD